MFNFTQEEQKAVMFILAMVLIGLGTNFLSKHSFPAKPVPSLNQELGRIDLNTADKELLMNIPGIGIKSAQYIIEYRQSHDGFSQTEELLQVKGITPGKYERIKGYIRIKQ
jgi:competence protein ComEA